LKTLALVGSVGGALSAFWVLPFFAKRTYVNDMGWVKITTYTNSLFFRNFPASENVLKDSPPFRVVFVLAVLGLLLSILRRNRMGIVLGIGAALVAAAFRYMPAGRLWNGRVLPSYYLYVYLLAAIGVGEGARLIADALASARLQTFVRNGAPIVAFISMWLVFGPALRALPGGYTDSAGVYHWPKRLSLITTRDHLVPPRRQRALADALRATIVEVQADHLAALVAPEAYVAATLTLIDRLTGYG